MRASNASSQINGNLVSAAGGQSALYVWALTSIEYASPMRRLNADAKSAEEKNKVPSNPNPEIGRAHV